MDWQFRGASGNSAEMIQSLSESDEKFRRTSEIVPKKRGLVKNTAI